MYFNYITKVRKELHVLLLSSSKELISVTTDWAKLYEV